MKYRAQIKWLFSRVAVFYIFLFFLVMFLVDIKSVISRFQTRNLNEARPGMEFIVSFNAQTLPPSKMEWVPYLNYFGLVMQYVPNEAVSEMFLGICQYYAKNLTDEAWMRIRHSAETHPFIFWNLYNAGILAFERGDMKTAADYFDKTLIVPESRIFDAIGSSIVYRQVMAASNFNENFAQNIYKAKKDAYLFLVAASYYAGDYNKALGIALASLEQTIPENKEPFLFYAGAASLSLGKGQDALVFFLKCIQLRSMNPLVYRYAGQILESLGNVEAARNMSNLKQSLGVQEAEGFPYKDRLRLRFF